MNSFEKADKELIDAFDRVAKVLLHERKYQIRRWSHISPQGNVILTGHEVAGYLMLMQEQIAKAQNEWCSATSDCKALDRIRNIAAIAIACLEQHGCTVRGGTRVVNARNGILYAIAGEEFSK